MHIVIIGSGSYVLGDAYGPGVVFRSALQYLRDLNGKAAPAAQGVSRITMTSRSAESCLTRRDVARDILDQWSIEASEIAVDVITLDGIGAVIEQADAVMISVPDAFHGLYAKLAIAAGKPLWLVKPLTGDLTAAQDLEKFYHETEYAPLFWVDYHKRFDPSNLYAHNQILNGDMGQLLSYGVDYHQPWRLPVECFDWAVDVDVFSYIGCHYVDQIFFHYPEARLKDVSAFGTKGRVHAAVGQYDSIAATLVFDLGACDLIAPMLVGWCLPDGAPMKSQQALKLQFEDGQLTLAQDDRGINAWTRDGVVTANPYFFTEQKTADGTMGVTGYGYESVRRFLDHVAGGSQPSAREPLLREAMKTEYVLSAVKGAL